MVKIITCLLLIFALVFLPSCENGREKSLDVFSGAFICEYSYELAGAHFRVTLERDETRRVRLTFAEPDTLSGISCTSVDGRCDVSFLELKIEGEGARGLLGSSELFFAQGEFLYSGMSEIGGRDLERFRSISEDGREICVYIDGESETPVLLTGEVGGVLYELRIISFTELGG